MRSCGAACRVCVFLFQMDSGRVEENFPGMHLDRRHSIIRTATIQSKDTIFGALGSFLKLKMLVMPEWERFVKEDYTALTPLARLRALQVLVHQAPSAVHFAAISRIVPELIFDAILVDFAAPRSAEAHSPQSSRDCMFLIVFSEGGVRVIEAYVGGRHPPPRTHCVFWGQRGALLAQAC